MELTEARCYVSTFYKKGRDKRKSATDVMSQYVQCIENIEEASLRLQITETIHES